MARTKGLRVLSNEEASESRKRHKTLAERRAEANERWLRELEEEQFKFQLALLGEDLMDSPPPLELAAPPRVLASCEEAYSRIEPMQFEYSDSEEEWGDGAVTEVDSEDEVEYVASKPSHEWKWGAEFIVQPNNGWVQIIEIH